MKNCVESRLSQQSAGQQDVHVQHAPAAFAQQVDPSQLAFAMLARLAAMGESQSEMLLETRRYPVGSDA